MLTLETLPRLLQWTDGLFPTGSFSFSDGLEAAAADGALARPGALDEWLWAALWDSFARNEGPTAHRCRAAMEAGDWAAAAALDRECEALRASAAVRAASRSVGRSVLRAAEGLIVGETAGAGEAPGAAVKGGATAGGVAGETPGGAGGSPAGAPASAELRARVAAGECPGGAPAAYAAVFLDIGAPAPAALAALGYLRLGGAVSAAQRLAALGQREAQAALARALADLPRAVARVLEDAAPPTAFAPLAEIHQANQRRLYSRLFRS